MPHFSLESAETPSRIVSATPGSTVEWALITGESAHGPYICNGSYMHNIILVYINVHVVLLPAF